MEVKFGRGYETENDEIEKKKLLRQVEIQHFLMGFSAV